MTDAKDDADILAAVALHDLGTMTFERVIQKRQTYYRMLCNGKPTGSGLTTAKGARDTIAYWRTKGWAE